MSLVIQQFPIYRLLLECFFLSLYKYNYPYTEGLNSKLTDHRAANTLIKRVR